MGNVDYVRERQVPFRRVADPVDHCRIVVERGVILFRGCDVVFADLDELHAGGLHGDGVSVIDVFGSLRRAVAREALGDALALHAGQVGQLFALGAVGAGENCGGPDEHRRRAAGHDEPVIGMRVV